MYWDKADKKRNAKQKNETKYLLQDFKKLYSSNKLWQSSRDLSGKLNPFLVFSKAAISESLTIGFTRQKKTNQSRQTEENNEIRKNDPIKHSARDSILYPVLFNNCRLFSNERQLTSCSTRCWGVGVGRVGGVGWETIRKKPPHHTDVYGNHLNIRQTLKWHPKQRQT